MIELKWLTKSEIMTSEDKLSSARNMETGEIETSKRGVFLESVFKNWRHSALIKFPMENFMKDEVKNKISEKLTGRKLTNEHKDKLKNAKKGSLLIFTTPFMYPLHGEPHDFQRITPYKIHNLMKNYGELQIEQLGGFATSVATLINNWINRNYLYRHRLVLLYAILALPLFAALNMLAMVLDRIDKTKAFPTNIGFILKITSDPL